MIKSMYSIWKICVLNLYVILKFFIARTAIINFSAILIRGRISSVGRALDCRAGGRGFDSRGRTNTQGLKITEK